MHTALSVSPFIRQTSWDEPDKPACDSTRKRINRRGCTISNTARQSKGQGREAEQHLSTLYAVYGDHSVCRHWSYLRMQKDNENPSEIRAEHSVIELKHYWKKMHEPGLLWIQSWGPLNIRLIEMERNQVPGSQPTPRPDKYWTVFAMAASFPSLAGMETVGCSWAFGHHPPAVNHNLMPRLPC